MAIGQYPKKWKDTSLDLKLMFGYHASMMVMMMAGGFLTVRQEIIVAAAIAVLIVLISRSHRQRRHWRWPGVKPRDVLYAAGGIVLISFFLYSATPLFPPNNGQIAPWYLAGLGIGLFGILQSLKIVYAAETEFASNCMMIDQYGRELEPPRLQSSQVEPRDANRSRVAKGIYQVTFMLVWVCGVASFYFFGTAFRSGSPEPTATQSEPLEDHGKIVYVTPPEKQRVHALQLVTWVGIPVVLLGGAALHFLVGVRLFPNTPTLAEYLNRSKNRPSEPRA